MYLYEFRDVERGENAEVSQWLEIRTKIPTRLEPFVAWLDGIHVHVEHVDVLNLDPETWADFDFP